MIFGQLVRRLSTTNKAFKLIQPPVPVFGVEGRYVTALYSAASKNKSLDVVEKDMITLRDILRKDAQLREFCTNPTIQRSTKAVEFSKVLDKLKCSEQTKNMFNVLAENGRLARIESVLDKFAQLMSAHRGEVSCVVRTAKPLDKSSEQALRAALNDFLKPGEQLNLTLEASSLRGRMDPSLIGGLVVSIGDRFVDMSIARKIRTYQTVMEQPI